MLYLKNLKAHQLNTIENLQIHPPWCALSDVQVLLLSVAKSSKALREIEVDESLVKHVTGSESKYARQIWLIGLVE